MASFLYFTNKNLEKIKYIVISIEAENVARQATNQTKNPAIMEKKKKQTTVNSSKIQELIKSASAIKKNILCF